ncbi:MAG TPA: glycosyltransferase family 2 protein [Solirubrobacteraceae bacterium]|nr:glycosyltransferase family 2 protein [Solirubrobacteraceae bacterium]
MSRPGVSVVVPFAGTAEQARAVLAMLGALDTRPDDQLIIADNSGTVGMHAGVTVVRAPGEASAAHSRNAGAAYVNNDWILFLDADVIAPADLLDSFFAEPIDARRGAVTGDIAGIPDTRTLAARYGTARNFLGQRSHVNNPLRPRASSANLLVRRAAFEQVGGYTEGIWAGEDTDFTWRLQAAGWTLGFNEHAVVEHAYRTSLRALGRQWRGYAAGARWLSQQYPDFKPDPGLNRGLRLLLKRFGIGAGVAFRADGRSSPSAARLGRGERLQFLFVQVYLGIEEQIGLRMSNAVKRR